MTDYERVNELRRRFPDGDKPPRAVYRFKWAEELAWFVAVAIISVLAQELLTFDATTVTDWRTWTVALLSATVRAGAGAMLAYFGKQAIKGEGR